MKYKKALSLLSAAALCLSLAACGGQENTENNSNTEVNGNAQEEESGSSAVTSITLTESWSFESGFYPVLTSSNSVNYGFSYWSKNFYDTLVGYDENGEIEGRIAERWEISEDGMVYTFYLRDGVKFSDGKDLTSEDIKSSFEAAIENLGYYNGSYGKISSIISEMDSSDERVFVMHLSQPYYAALNDLTMTTPLAIVSTTAFENGYADAYNVCLNATMGSGPYMYEGDFDGTTYSFVRNPYYWGETPELESFQVKIIEDNDAKVLALRAGEIDAIIGSSRMNYDAFAELSADPTFASSINDVNTLTRYLGFNLSVAPFDDVLVRQAINHALDKETLCSVILGGIEAPADVLFDSDKPYCDVEQTSYSFDLEQANALMEQAGWIDTDGDGVREKDGQTLEMSLIYMQTLGSLDDAVLTVADQLSKIGFNITPNGTDMMSWYNAMLSGDYMMSFYFTYGGAYDPSTVLTNMNPNVSTDPIFMQYAALFDDGVALVGQLDSTDDLALVQEIYAEILGTISEEAALAPLCYSREFAVWRSDVMTGYDYSTDCQYINIAGIHVS